MQAIHKQCALLLPGGCFHLRLLRYVILMELGLFGYMSRSVCVCVCTCSYLGKRRSKMRDYIFACSVYSGKAGSVFA